MTAYQLAMFHCSALCIGDATRRSMYMRLVADQADVAWLSAGGWDRWTVAVSLVTGGAACRF